MFHRELSGGSLAAQAVTEQQQQQLDAFIPASASALPAASFSSTATEWPTQSSLHRSHTASPSSSSSSHSSPVSQHLASGLRAPPGFGERRGGGGGELSSIASMTTSSASSSPSPFFTRSVSSPFTHQGEDGDDFAALSEAISTASPYASHALLSSAASSSPALPPVFSAFRHGHTATPLPAPPAFAEQRSSHLSSVSPASSAPVIHALHAAHLQRRGHDVEDEEYYLALARHKQQQQQQQSSSSSSVAAFTSSPGPGIRRLAESFLDSIGDESSTASRQQQDAAAASRSTQQQPAAQASMQAQAQLLDRGHAGYRDAQQAGRLLYEERVLHASGGDDALAAMRAELMERKRREVDEMLLSMSRKQQRQQLAAAHADLVPSMHSMAFSMSSSSLSPTPSPPSSRPSSDPSSASSSSSPFLSLHAEILHFAATCQHLQQHQSALRDDLCLRTRRAVQSVWPSAEVDLVGSVSAGVALPKSDLDFVVFFPVSAEADSRPPYTFPAIEDDGHASLDPGSISRQQAEAAEPRQSSPSAQVHHFAHAGSLIKLLGGRKKSKLLFRSTKIQVFKDINLIRLRDGCSGISMDLWFPTSSFITLRSQQHTRLISSFLTSFPFFYPLSVVVKSFMQQQMLNSGYSGLGSYGVLLMIVRFLQHQRELQRKREERERDNAANDSSNSSSTAELPPMDSLGKERASSSSSTSSTSSAFSAAASSFSSSSSSSSSPPVTADNNLGRALCEFFRFYCVFDYAAKAIDVRGDGCFMDKPELSTIQRKAKVHAGPAAPPSMGEDDDDADNNSEDEQADRTDGSEAAAAAAAGDGSAESSYFTAYTLVIQDPLDVNNFILCHHRALRNMVQAFMQALSILDPDSPLPAPAAALIAPSTQTAQTMTASHASSASAAMFHTQYAQLPPSVGIGRSTSDVVYPSSLITLPSHHASPSVSPSSSASAPLSRFQRLLDVQAAYAGPAMKDCPSAPCRLMSPPNLCPIQNKVCFACGYMFVKNQSGGMRHQHQSRGGKKRSTAHGGPAAAHAPGAGGGGQGGRSRMNGLAGLANGAQQQQQHAGGLQSASHPALLNSGQLQRGRSDKQRQQLQQQQHHAYLQQQHLGGMKPFASRSGFSTEPSSPTFHSQSHPRHPPQRQYSRSGASTAAASFSHLVSQPAAYMHSAAAYSPSSPPPSASHGGGGGVGMIGHLSLSQSASASSAASSPHMSTSASSMSPHAAAFTRTQSHPVQSISSLSPFQHGQQSQLLHHSAPSSTVRAQQQQQQLGYGGSRSGALMSQAASPAFDLPFMSNTRYRASSANELTAVQGATGRRPTAAVGGSRPSLSPPMSAPRYVNSHSAPQHQQPSYGLQSSIPSSPFSSLPPQQQQQQLFPLHHPTGFQ